MPSEDGVFLQTKEIRWFSLNYKVLMGCTSKLRQLNTSVFTPMSMVILSMKKSRDPRELPVD